jgi:hypothetical protein
MQRVGALPIAAHHCGVKAPIAASTMLRISQDVGTLEAPIGGIAAPVALCASTVTVTVAHTADAMSTAIPAGTAAAVVATDSGLGLTRWGTAASSAQSRRTAAATGFPNASACFARLSTTIVGAGRFP